MYFHPMKKKVVLITGGSSGIGYALAERYGKADCAVVISGRNGQTLDEAVARLQNAGIEAAGFRMDVSVDEQCADLVAFTIQTYGRLDILINNAGISMRALFQDVDLLVLRQLMNINFWGTVFTTKAALPHILKSKGSIVGISSIAGFRGLPARTGYSASKFAMQGFLEALRTELLKTGVHVLIACPGFTASNIRNTALTADGNAQKETPMDESKLMSAEACANHIFIAVQKRKRTLILTTQGKLTVFLNKFFGGFMDKMVYNHFAKEPDSPLK